MGGTCCRFLIGTVSRVPSPFSRVVAVGYYDGPTSGVVECGVCATLYRFEKLDWDDEQDVRIFSLSPVRGRSISELTQDSGGVVPSWPVWVLGGAATEDAARLVEEISAAADPVEFIVATENLLGTIEVWRPVGLAGDVDWFSELGIERRRTSR